MPTMTVPSATMRRLRRELEISRNRNSKAPLAPTGGVVAKKPSPPPPSKSSKPSSPAPRCNPEPTAPPAPRRADGDAGPERARPTLTTTSTSTSSRSRSRSRQGAAPPTEQAEAIIKSKCIGKGAQVRVRTRVGTVCTGQHLVLWLRAVVESAADEDADGCLRVAYDYTNGKFPRIARVSPNDVKLHLHVPPAADASAAATSTGSCIATSDHSARTSSSSQQDKAAPPPRPTVAGKKLPLLKKLEKEMLSSSKAIMGCF